MSVKPVEAPIEAHILDHPCSLYEHAVLHIVVAGLAKKWRLLFAFIELLPLEVPPPVHDKFVKGPHLKRSGWRVFADHVPLSATVALAWYQDARAGTVVRPQSDGSVARPSDPAVNLCEPLGWSEEPAWPSYVLAASEHRLPFLSRWHQTPRMHHLMPSTTAWDFTPEESAVIDEFLEREVGFRRSGWMQLAETIHLVAPNPYYRLLHARLISAAPPIVESICVSVEPRNRVVLPQLEVELAEHRPTGRSTTVTVPLDAQPRMVAMGPALHETSTIVRLTAGGLLEITGPSAFPRELLVTMNFVHGKRIVPVRDGLGRVLETYEVEVAHPNLTSRAGTSVATEPASALKALMNDVSVRDAAQRLEQRWFASDEAAARYFVRSLIRGARDQVLIADPYLGSVEVQRYALAVQLAGVPVRLLTTRMGFGNNSVSPTLLQASIDRWRASEASLGQIEIRVMEYDKLHDRFLRIDSRLYILGNSLNALGDKGSLVIRIPDPTPIFHELESIWASAEPLVDVAMAST